MSGLTSPNLRHLSYRHPSLEQCHQSPSIIIQRKTKTIPWSSRRGPSLQFFIQLNKFRCSRKCVHTYISTPGGTPSSWKQTGTLVLFIAQFFLKIKNLPIWKKQSNLWLSFEFSKFYMKIKVNIKEANVYGEIIVSFKSLKMNSLKTELWPEPDV